MGYSAYTRLAKAGTGASNETVTLAGCWVHSGGDRLVGLVDCALNLTERLKNFARPRLFRFFVGALTDA